MMANYLYLYDENKTILGSQVVVENVTNEVEITIDFEGKIHSSALYIEFFDKYFDVPLPDNYKFDVYPSAVVTIVFGPKGLISLD